MTDLRAAVFDWGGTLAVHAPMELVDLWRAAARILDQAREDELVEALIAVEARSWSRIEGSMRSSRLMDLVREASEDVGLDVAEAVLAAARDAHLDAWTPTIQHVPSAVEVLTGLRARGLAIGLLSNTHWPRSFHERFLARDGLEGLIDQRLYTSEIDWMKPHPMPFASIADRLDVDPEECVYVGDRPIDDIQGAREAGMRTVWIANDYAPGDGSLADVTITDLAELPAVIDAL